MDRLFIARELISHRLGDRLRAVTDPRTSSTRIIPELHGWALGECKRFKRLDEHAAYLRELGWEGTDHPVEDALAELVRLDLLRDSESFLAALADVSAAGVGVSDGAVTTIAWPTRNRLPVLARNAVLLACAGERFLSADDDTVCAFAGTGGSGLRLFSFYDPTNCRFFGSPGELDEEVTEWEGDPVALHEDYLGAPLNGLLASTREPLIRLVSPAFVARLEARGGSVAATLTGSWGDSGMGASRMILNLRGSLRESLGLDRYEMARGSRLLLRVAHEATLSEGPFFMGMHFGVDATTLVPPFFPVKTDEDGLWGILLRAAFPDRLAGIGRRLCELARRPWPELRLHLKERWLDATAESIDYLEEVLVTFRRSPRAWADDVDAYIASLVSYAERRDFGLPYDIRLANDTDDAVAQRLAALIDAYGRLLIDWPAIFSLAREWRDGAEMEEGIAG